jgi:hypothetical protein
MGSQQAEPHKGIGNTRGGTRGASLQARKYIGSRKYRGFRKYNGSRKYIVLPQKRCFPQTQCAYSCEPLVISIKINRRRLPAIGKDKSEGPDRDSCEILKLHGEDTISYLQRLLDISIINATIQSDWKNHSGSYLQRGWSLAGLKLQTCQFNLSSLQTNGTRCYNVFHWMFDWVFESQHGFMPRYSCESQVITVCQDTAHSLDDWGRICYYNGAFEGFRFSPPWSSAYENFDLGSGLDGNCMDKETPLGPYTES